MKVGFVCSHGGHLTEITYLLTNINYDDAFLITYDHPRTRNLKIKKYLLPNFGENPLKLLKYLPFIAKILIKEKPDVIISNGAEIAIPLFYLAKILSIKTVFIECYTRVNQPTITGKLVYPISDGFLVLWEEMLPKYGKKAYYFGPFMKEKVMRIKPSKRLRLILTLTGTHFKGFDRLTKAIDDISRRLPQYTFLIQKGSGTYEPRHSKYFYFTEYQRIKNLLKISRIAVTQGAISIVDALEVGTPVVSFPRLKRHGEAINDHQLEFSRKLESMGLIRVATDKRDLLELIVVSLEALNRGLTKSLEFNRRIISIIKERWL